jgi:hypothetical protein
MPSESSAGFHVFRLSTFFFPLGTFSELSAVGMYGMYARVRCHFSRLICVISPESRKPMQCVFRDDQLTVSYYFYYTMFRGLPVVIGENREREKSFFTQ